MHRTDILVRIAAGIALIPSALALGQFQTSTTTSSATASATIVTTIGNKSGTDGGPGIGSYPSIARDARTEDGVGTNSFQATGSISLEFEPTRIFINASAGGSLSGTEEVSSGNASGSGKFETTFQLSTAMSWSIPSASMAISGSSSAFIKLRKGASTIFTYSSTVGNVGGTLQPGEYTLSGDASASVDWTIGGASASANLSAQFELAPAVIRCTGDFNTDGQVDDADFLVFVMGYNLLLCSDPSMVAGCPADLNGDGQVDDADFPLFVVAYNTLTCP
ncbi:MAG: hypothetical protein ACREJD_15020 [Phycisphaerales bacterium]